MRVAIPAETANEAQRRATAQGSKPGRLEPSQRQDLQCNVETECSLIRGHRIVPILVRPLLKHQSRRVLEDEGCTGLKEVERTVGTPGNLLGETLGHDRVAENCGRSKNCDDEPGHHGWY